MTSSNARHAAISLRAASRADLPRIHAIRHGTRENRLSDPSRVTDDEVAWYLAQAICLVSEEEADVRGFVFVNHQTGYVWALFVDEGAHGQGHGTALLDAAMARLREDGHRQAFLSTGRESRAAWFYRARGWDFMGENLRGEAVFRLIL